MAREGEADALLGRVLVAFEAGGLLLGDADEDHALFSGKAGALLGSDSVLLLTAAEMDDRDIVLLGEGIDGVHKAFEQRSEQGW